MSSVRQRKTAKKDNKEQQKQTARSPSEFRPAAPPADPSDIEIGRSYYVDAESAGEQGILSTLAALTTLTLYTGFIHVMTGLLIASFWSWTALGVYVLLWSTIFWPATPLWEGFLNMWLFKTWRHYFKFSYVLDERLDLNTNYVFAQFPHGVAPMGSQLAITCLDRILPGIKCYSISASIMFRLPMFRHFFTWMGAQPATKKNFLKLVKLGSCGVVVGGLAEMYMQYDDKEAVMLRTRKGFVRVAVESGAPIVPVFYLGNSQVLGFGPRALQSVSRRMRFSMGLLYGKFGLPVPHRHPIHMIVGKAVPAPKVSPDDENFAKVVDEVHAKVMQELQAAYDRHRAEFGWADRPLEIM